MNKATSKYLQNYAEPEIAALQFWPGEYFQHVLVIPCYRESAEFLTRFKQQFSGQQVLLILVVNQPDSDGNIHSNCELLDHINATSQISWQQQNISLQLWGDNCGLLLVQRWQGESRIPHKQGVGLARKIGADLACWLIARQFIRSGWIHSSDADAELPADYFAHLPPAQCHSAALYPFRHIGGSAEINAAVKYYEQALHYYVDNLREASSPWAFHTIGSILAISAHYYAQARGFPKKSAGEDFYLLNKLGKLAPIVELDRQGTIELQARLSDRVPFGTGPATAKIAAQLQAGEEPLWYAAEVFIELKQFLQCALRGELQQAAENAHWSAALKELGWQNFIDHCAKQHLSAERCKTAFHHALNHAFNNWFDAFRTLRFIHLMQAQWYPAKPLRELLADHHQDAPQTISIKRGLRAPR